jgi:pimeloyl-ACP methyl ester carboxylesterase
VRGIPEGTLPALAERYHQVRCPTLVLWGQQDRHFPPVHAVGLHARLPNARLDVLPAGEHWMAWHQAQSVADSILRFAAGD